jgi:hypothetical protein
MGTSNLKRLRRRHPSKGEHMRDTIDMAEEAGAISYWHLSRLKAFEALVRADERARLQPKKIEAVKEDDYCHGDERYYAND